MGRKHCRNRRNLLVTSNFSISHSVFKRFVVQTHKNQGLFGKGLNLNKLKIFINGVQTHLHLFHIVCSWVCPSVHLLGSLTRINFLHSEQISCMYHFHEYWGRIKCWPFLVSNMANKVASFRWNSLTCNKFHSYLQLKICCVGVLQFYLSLYSIDTRVDASTTAFENIVGKG